MDKQVEFRAWDESQKYMAYQGTPDLETLQSFMFHFGDKELFEWTGRLDTNGVKIFEGDINKEGKVILWCDECSSWQIGFIDDSFDIVVPCNSCEGNFCFLEVIEDFTVAGNIREGYFQSTGNRLETCE